MQPKIFERIENSKSIDFGNVISKSFELYKKVFSQGIIHSLVALGVAIPLLLIVYVPLAPIYIEMLQTGGDPYYAERAFEDYGVIMIVIWYFFVFIMSFILQIVNMSIFGHFYKLLKKEDLGTNEDIGGYFDLLKNHFGKLLLLTLATFGIALLAALLCYLPIFYVIVPLHWLFPIFVFNEKLTVRQIINAAFKFGNKNWGILFGLGFVCHIISSLGAFACYVGLIATLFFSYVATYITYRDSIGFEETDEKITEVL